MAVTPHVIAGEVGDLGDEQGGASQRGVGAPATALGPAERAARRGAQHGEVQQVRGQQARERVREVRERLVGPAEGAVRQRVRPEDEVQQPGVRAGEPRFQHVVERRQRSEQRQPREQHVGWDLEPRLRFQEDVLGCEGRERGEERDGRRREEQMQCCLDFFGDRPDGHTRVARGRAERLDEGGEFGEEEGPEECEERAERGVEEGEARDEIVAADVEYYGLPGGHGCGMRARWTR